MSHLTSYAVVAAAAALVVAFRVIRPPGVSNGRLAKAAQEEAKRLEELLPRLLPYAYYADRKRIISAVGGVSGLRVLGRSCRDLAALIVCQAEAEGGSGVIRDQARRYSRLAWWVVPLAIAEAWVRRRIPLWPPLFTSFAIVIWCQLACTYEALLAMV